MTSPLLLGGNSLYSGGLHGQWIAASDMLNAGGSPSITVEGGSGSSQVPIWRLDAASIEMVCGSTVLPGGGTTTVDIHGIFCSIGSGNGDVVLRATTEQLVDGARIGDVDVVHATVTQTVTAAAAGIMEFVTLVSGLTVTEGVPIGITVERVANDAADTLAVDYCLIGVRIVRAS